MTYIIERLEEPSTHAGLAALAQAAKFIAPQWAFVFDAITTMFAGFAVMRKG